MNWYIRARRDGASVKRAVEIYRLFEKVGQFPEEIAERLYRLTFPRPTQYARPVEYYIDRHKLNRAANKYFVTCGIIGRNYGGPEEGGWWFDTWEPVDRPTNAKHLTAAQAWELCRKLNGLADREYRYRVTRGQAYPQPHTIPHYC